MRHPTIQRGIFALSLVLSLSFNAFAQDQSELKPGEKIEREIKGGQVHTYRIRLEAGEYVEFRLEKRGINPPLVVKDGSGKTIFEAKFEERMNDETLVAFLAEAAGEFLVIVEPNFAKAPPGRYSLSMSAPRQSSEADRRRFRAQSAFMEAQVLDRNGSRQTRIEALNKLEESLALWRGLEDRIWAGRIVFWQGWVCFWMTEYSRSMEYLNRALDIRRSAGDRMGEADVLRAIGIVHLFQRQNTQAAERYLQALQIQKEFPEPWQHGFTQVELGKLYFQMNDHEKGQRFFDESLDNFQATGAEESAMEALTSLSTFLWIRGDLQPALDILHRALPVFQAAGHGQGQAVSNMNLGVIHYNLGESERGYEYFTQSLALARRYDLKQEESNALINMGIVKLSMGEPEKAIEHFTEALDLMRKTSNLSGESNVLRQIGQAYLELGKDREAAESYHRALEISRKDGKLHIEGEALRGLGEVQSQSGDRARAIETLKLAVDRARQARNGLGLPKALSSLARVERQSGDLPKAKEHLEEALDLIDQRRATVAETELRISYLSINQGYFEEYIDLLMDMRERDLGKSLDAQALQADERARARALLDSLAENRAKIRRGGDPELITREASLQRRVSSLETQRLRLSMKPEQIEALDKSLDAALADLQQIQAKLRTTSPRYADLIRPRPLDLKQMQALLDPNTLLLVYKLGRRRGFLWVVSREDLKSYVLPAKTELAKEAIAYHEILNHAPATKGRDEEDAARRLYARLLGPAAGDLGKNRLIVVADGALQLTPFAALIDSQSGRRLIEQNEIIYLPSISSLALLREAGADRKPAPKTLAIFADPVFELSDPRLKGKASAPTTNRPDPRRTALRSAEEAGDLVLRRLEFSREEANQIARLTPPSMHTKLLDFDASRASLQSMDLRQYRILHIATHGVLNPKRPELSGLALSLYDAQGKPQDGFLAAHDVYNLEIGADLVTLSACQTARGKDAPGEGIVGLARGFFYAGAPRLVASLWKVDDLASARFMTRFYKGLLEQGLSPATALRKAQIDLQNSRDWSAPYYWAAFTLQGEYRP